MGENDSEGDDEWRMEYTSLTRIQMRLLPKSEPLSNVRLEGSVIVVVTVAAEDVEEEDVQPDKEDLAENGREN